MDMSTSLSKLTFSPLDLSTYSSDDSVVRKEQKKMVHNETEKKRMRTMNKHIDDLKVILEDAKVLHKTDKVSILDASLSYLKSLLKEKDRLTSSLGYIDGVLPNSELTASEDENDSFFVEEPSPFDQNLQTEHRMLIEVAKRRSLLYPGRYQDHSLMHRIALVDAESQNGSGDLEDSNEKPSSETITQSTSSSSSTQMRTLDYKCIWTNNNVATVVVHIESCQLLKGNNRFMKLFQFMNAEELQQLSLFDLIIVNDLTLFWGEYGQLVNCSRQSIRSFVATITNPSRNISLPCLVMMGQIMDYQGYIYNVSVSFTPLIQVNDNTRQNVDVVGMKATTLEKII